MDKYIKNLLPRLKQYGKKLNKIEDFVDKTWVLYEPGKSFQSFRFMRKNKLLITVSGIVQEHEWDYLPPDSLYIKRGAANGIMYRQAFLLDSLFVMQVEGVEFNPVLFYNESKIPDGDVYKYLKKKYASINNYGTIGTDIKYFYSSDYGQELVVGAKVFDEEFQVVKDKKISINSRYITISNGVVSRIEYFYYVSSNKGKIKLSSSYRSPDGLVKGASVSLENGGRVDGKIEILNHTDVLYIIVEDGKIKKIKNNLSFVTTIVIWSIFLLLIFIIIYLSRMNN